LIGALQGRVLAADAWGMAARWESWGRCLVTAVAGAAVTFVSFGTSRPVPLFDWFDLGIHELGHLLAVPLPQMAMLIAGSAAQIAFPVAMAVYFGVARGDRAAAGFCMAWAGTSAWDVSVYIADAPVQGLPLIGSGVHDWATILGPDGFDAMARSSVIAGSVKWTGLGLAVAGILVSLSPALRLATRSVLSKTGMSPVRRGTRSYPAPAGDPWLTEAILPSGESEGSRIQVLSRRRS
jgi:hypothetical protein